MTQRRVWAYSMVGLLVPLTAGQVGGPVQPGDMALGLSVSAPANTAQLVRAGALQGGWRQIGFMQSMEFDNLNGLSHNAAGNLLGLNFGTTNAGGSLANLATNGTDAGQTFFLFDGSWGTRSRVGGLSVSPDNTRLAVMGSDSLSLYILSYTAGNGDGSGASAVGLVEGRDVYVPAGTQGSAWFDNDIVLAYRLDAGFDPNQTQLLKVDASSGGYGVLTDDIPVTGGTSNFLDVEYNPLVAPWVICSHATLVGGITNNVLTFIDANDWTILKQVSLSLSLNTARELALGPDRRLYISAYGGSQAVGPIIDTLTLDVNGDNVLDGADLAAMTDNSSVNYYQAVGISSSFNGLDLAVQGPSACDPCDMTCDGEVNAFDIENFIDVLFNGEQPCSDCAGDVNGDSQRNAFDIEPFITCLFGP